MKLPRYQNNCLVFGRFQAENGSKEFPAIDNSETTVCRRLHTVHRMSVSGHRDQSGFAEEPESGVKAER